MILMISQDLSHLCVVHERNRWLECAFSPLLWLRFIQNESVTRRFALSSQSNKWLVYRHYLRWICLVFPSLCTSVLHCLPVGSFIKIYLSSTIEGTLQRRCTLAKSAFSIFLRDVSFSLFSTSSLNRCQYSRSEYVVSTRIIAHCSST